MNRSCSTGLILILAAFHLLFLCGRSLAADPSLTVRQNHLLFELVHHDGRLVCGIQEIVVVESQEKNVYENPAGTVRFSIPPQAEHVGPLPVPNIMPGDEPPAPLREDEIEISKGQLVIKRPLRPGKNTFSFGYVLPSENDSVRLEKQLTLQTRLLAAFAPKVREVTSRSLQVDRAPEGYKILGHNLPAGTTIDLKFDGLHEGMTEGPARRAGSENQGGVTVSSSAPSPASAGDPMARYMVPTLAGLLLGVLLFLYGIQVRKGRAAVENLRRFLLDEIESLDAASEKKEISAEFHKRQKKALMDRLRTI